MSTTEVQQSSIYSIVPASCGGYLVKFDGVTVRHGKRPVMFGTVQFALEHIWFDAAYAEIEYPEIHIDLDTLSIRPSLRHPTDPHLFKTPEGYVTSGYVTRRCIEVECTYSLWQGSREDGKYVPMPPIIYENASREQAYTNLVSALESGDESINKWMQPYSDVRTREVEVQQ